LRVYTATGHFHGSILSLFNLVGAETSVLPAKKHWKNLGEFDVLVFAGGEDVSPERYGQNPDGIHFTTERDEKELEIMTAVFSEELKPRGVLGICRGVQLMNVAFGGTLVRDIFQYTGNSHHSYHSISHRAKHPLDFLKTVNSLHHQAILKIGMGEKLSLRPKILSTHSLDRLPEIVSWGNKFLGVQFHPEFFPSVHPEKKMFAETIKDWVTGKKSFYKDEFIEFKESLETASGRARQFGVSWEETERTFTVDTSEEIFSYRANEIREEEE
jgi:putative glutamine amidotransferase